MENNILVSLTGPTAIGKTAMSIHLAGFFNANIVSCDSRQFYKEMSIGTAVPSASELKAVTHHFIQNRSIFEDYSVGSYETDAIHLLSDLFKKNNIQFLTGGSGLYADAVINGLDDFPRVDPEIRTGLKEKLSTNGIDSLQQQLKELDKTSFEKIDIHNPQRLIRALEICIGTGKPYAYYLGKKSTKRNFKTIKIGLRADREIVYKRINERVDLMMKEGLLEEAKKLYPHKELNALQTVGYKEIFKYLDQEDTLEFAISEIKKNTRRFAKRQGTWFRKDKSIAWFDYQTKPETIISYLQTKIAEINI